MDAEMRREVQQLREQVSGVTAAVELGFQGVKKDVHYLGRAYLPLMGGTLLALVLALCALVIALENRNLVLSVSSQTSANSRDIEHLIPLIKQAAPDTTKGK